jgi:hypothetical protein
MRAALGARFVGMTSGVREHAPREDVVRTRDPVSTQVLNDFAETRGEVTSWFFEERRRRGPSRSSGPGAARTKAKSSASRSTSRSPKARRAGASSACRPSPWIPPSWPTSGRGRPIGDPPWL